MYVWVSGPSLLPLPSLLNEILSMCRSPPKGQNQPYLCLSEELLETNHTYLYLYMPDTDDVSLRNSFTSKQLLHTCLTHLSLGTYLHTFLSFSTTVISSIPSIAIHTIHSLRHRHRHCKPKYLTSPHLPRISSYQSIQSVNWSLAVQTRDPRLTSGIREGEVANNDGGLPYYPSWVISRRRRSWCC